MIISSKCVEINTHCNEIISELLALNQYVSYEKVYCILLQRYNSLCFNQLLGYDNAVLEDIPTLAILYELSKKINYFLDSYFVTRSIISLTDLTYECSYFLQSFNLPSLHSFLYHKENMKADPLEIDIQTNDSSNEFENVSVSQFHDFGVGSLLKHPKMINMISNNHDNTTVMSNICNELDFAYQTFLTLNEVYELLIDYMYQIKWKQVIFDKNDFTLYICTKYDVQNLTTLGVILIGDLKSEINALQHSLNSRFNYIIELNKKELLKYNKQEDEEVTHSKRKKMKTHNNLKEVNEDSIDNNVVISNNSININTTESSSFYSTKKQITEKYLECYSQKMYFHKENSLDDKDIIMIDNTQLIGCFPLPIDSYNNNTHEMNKMIGRWGEQLVYQYLIINRAQDMSIKWLNEEEESRSSYDFMLKYENKTSNNSKNDIIYIEVKSTRYNDKNMFEISLWEWQFASSESQVPYHIYRVYNAGDPLKAKIVIVKNILRLVTEGKIKLCLAI